MALEEVCVAAFTFLLCWYLLKKRSLPSPHPGTRHPPCLTALPIVGSIPFLKIDRNELARQLMEKSKTLGSVFALYLGSKYVVVLNGTDSIRDALLSKSSQFAGRRMAYIEHHYVNVNHKGVIASTYDDAFRRKHRLYLSILKRFGFGEHSMETRINANVQEFIKEAKANEGRPFDPMAAIGMSVMNIITGLAIGRRFPYGHPTLVEIRNLVHDRMAAEVSSRITLFPLLRFVPSIRKRMNFVIAKARALLSTLDEVLSDVLVEVDSAVDDDDSFIRHFVASARVQLYRKSTEPATYGDDDVSERCFDREELLYTVRDFFLAGTETSMSTIRWFLILMANHIEIQSQMQEEIDAVVGRDRLPSLKDEQSMPYSQAVILETMRRYTLLPLSLFHSTMCDTKVGDLFIPANTTIIVNLYSAHMNSSDWKDPDTFRPERFIDDDGAVCGKDRVIAFSLGKRSCLGETLARQELFLFMTGIVQNFNIRPVEEQQQITCGSITDSTHQPSPYEVRLISRLS